MPAPLRLWRVVTQRLAGVGQVLGAGGVELALEKGQVFDSEGRERRQAADQVE